MKTDHINLSGNDKLTLISNFSTMYSAGIPIIETIDSLLDDAKGNQKKILETLKADLMQGTQVSASFSRFPLVFDKVAVNILRAAEEAGTLDTTLKELKENIKKEMEFSDKIKSAMIYPAVILFVFFGVLMLMLTYVIPRITEVFLRMNIALPLPTKILIFLSDLVLKQTIPLIVGLVFFATIIVFLYKAKRRLLITMFVSLPLVSSLARSIDLTRFSRSMYMLLSAGIPITTSLELTKDVVKKKEIYHAIEESHQYVISGQKFSEGLKKSKQVIPSLMIKITEAGEKSGSLDKSMFDISEFLDYQVTNKLRTVTAVIEPLMLLFVGILVGGMMLAIIAPIYGLISDVGSR